MNDIKIVMYEHGYAQPLADMWNKSGENWGGEDVIKTAEDIINENESMGNICAYLALDGEEVVGYCSFSEYKQDEGASYIPLLNVRPDCIGKKIGKKLVLECVNKAMGEKWPRLDLYTWQGNDKAVPLYKKCGFFWENRDDSTHLMNFIPYVMRTEAVKEFFEVFDWYKDNKRDIKVECDGRLEGDFDYFDYRWEKDGLNLAMEFERRGRGLTCIKTNDYLIRARVTKQNLVSGRDYDITYEVVNISGKPLHVAIEGVEDKNIAFDFEYAGDIKGQEKIVANYHLDAIDEPQDKWKTHPCVTAQVTINGQKALFKVGINPKLPIKMAIGDQENPRVIGENTCYVDIENGFDEEMTMTCRLASTDVVTFDEPEITCTIKASEKVSIPVKCQVLTYGFYNQMIDVVINTKNETLEHQAKLRGAFRGRHGRYHGEDEKNYFIYNGSYCVNLFKKNNALSLKRLGGHEKDALYIIVPLLGKPYFNELENKKPEYVELISKETSEMMKAHYPLEKKSGIELDVCIELLEEGIINTFVEIVNVTDDHNFDTLYVTQQFYQLCYNSHLPYDGSIMRTPNADGMLPYKWDSNKLDEPWVFSQYEGTRCIGWDPSMNVTLNHVFLSLETEIKDLKPGEGFVTQPVTCAVDAFDTWQAFRRYMGHTTPVDPVKQDFQCVVNDNNPFIEESKVAITFEEAKKIPIEGKVNAISQMGAFGPMEQKLTYTDNKAAFTLSYNKVPEMDVLHMDIDTINKCISREKAIFFKGSDAVVTESYMEHDVEVYKVSNGLVTMKSAPSFASGIYSLSYKGHEWLDSSFPTPAIKGWWNYWTGGMHTKPEKLSYASAYEEVKHAEFVHQKDNMGNMWSGIKTTLSIDKQKELKGIVIEEYFLLLPGVPVICQYAVITQNMDKYLLGEKAIRLMFIKAGDDVKDNYVWGDNRGQKEMYRCMGSEFDFYVKKYMIHGSNKQDYLMTRLLSEGNIHEFYHTNGVNFTEDFHKLNMPHGTKKATKPSFILFSKDMLDDVVLEDLYGIQFDV
ncbi:GNAT family N-acetyltransferase [Vallitalea pronyensis]|uniref:GNAT family N-acetyltransferase n=1 Tax=Vallitalea pronyensis TaxID=1348613 RepID=A0A8J8MJ57_9FIRM|nr:GNAT family N-acetyltransferase [Vallitalea pronyensis]QUI22614.1 GNAT family N-acetyltransferase [Vallitalea pronyensis]